MPKDIIPKTDRNTVFVLNKYWTKITFENFNFIALPLRFGIFKVMLNVTLDSLPFAIKVFSFYLYLWIDLSFTDPSPFNTSDIVGTFVVEAVGTTSGVFLFSTLSSSRFSNFYNTQHKRLKHLAWRQYSTKTTPYS